MAGELPNKLLAGASELTQRADLRAGTKLPRIRP